MQSMDQNLMEQKRIIEAQNGILNTLENKGSSFLNKLSFNKNQEESFNDLAFGLYLFIERLYKTSLEKGVQDLFFFSREGQPLKEMFDFYQASRGVSPRIRSHYFRVSRRSTFLMSLGKLSEETFEVLFRQYRHISIVDFLKSLDLDDHISDFAEELELELNDFTIAREDLPSDGLFQSLIQSSLFSRIYESERLARSFAFEKYLKSFFEKNFLPDVLYVVDVGWKGSIQDNLFNWMQNSQEDKVQIEGFYLGLIAKGGMRPGNNKSGLLFSNIEGTTRGFHIFNENRSLFEIILHADHGSAKRYVLESNGAPKVIEDEYVESKMIYSKINPTLNSVISLFRKIVTVNFMSPLSEPNLFSLVKKKHARMVFKPFNFEINWMDTVTHLENFGVFEESSFAQSVYDLSFSGRAKFSLNLIVRRRPSELGFWPWKSIKNRAIPGLSQVYAFVRIIQSL
jgi:predicted HAD superfamily hydrolase